MDLIRFFRKRLADLWSILKTNSEIIVSIGFVINAIIISSAVVPFLDKSKEFAFGKIIDLGIALFAVGLGIPFALWVNRIWKRDTDTETRIGLLIMIHHALALNTDWIDEAFRGSFSSNQIPTHSPVVSMFDDSFSLRYSLIESRSANRLIDKAVFEMHHLKEATADHIHLFCSEAGRSPRYLSEGEKLISDVNYPQLKLLAIGSDKALKEDLKSYGGKMDFTNRGVNSDLIEAIGEVEELLRKENVEIVYGIEQRDLKPNQVVGFSPERIQFVKGLRASVGQ